MSGVWIWTLQPGYGQLVGPSILRLHEVGFLNSSNPLELKKLKSTLRAFEKDAFLTAVSQRTFPTTTLLWYAENMRVCGRFDQAKTLLEGIMGNCSSGKNQHLGSGSGNNQNFGRVIFFTA